MKDFYCVCGQRVFFENSQCLKCGRALGFDPQSQTMLALQPQAGGELLSEDGQRYRNCRNHHDFGACNWLLPVDDQRTYCQSCRLNKVVPDLSETGTVIQWAKLEAAKRHLIYTLMQLGLPVEGKQEAAELGISFAFLEDSRFNANVREAYIATGHASGLITLNLAEADDEHREKTRRQLGEYYRTIVGHFRHESGHYYYDLLVRGKHWETPFRELFGNPDRDYQKVRALRTAGISRLALGLHQCLCHGAPAGRLGRNLGALPAHAGYAGNRPGVRRHCTQAGSAR